jgi:integrase/recombinase XerD
VLSIQNLIQPIQLDEGVLTTFYSYGEVADYRQAELLKKLAKPITDITAEKQTEFETMFKKMMNNQ